MRRFAMAEESIAAKTQLGDWKLTDGQTDRLRFGVLVVLMLGQY
jgi:hypothetical protein